MARGRRRADRAAVGGAVDDADGGVTAGDAGGKFMNANVFNESWDWGGQVVTWSGSTITNDLTSAHTGLAFIKTLDPNNNYSTIDYITVELVAGEDFSLSFTPTAGHLTQAGFAIDGNRWKSIIETSCEPCPCMALFA